MQNLLIGGVPEHFNLPWKDAIDSLASGGEQVQWRDVPEGTGAMAAALRTGTLDVAILLTEGAVAALGADPSFGILSTYTASPLLWGIHVPAESLLVSEDDIRGRRYAISRKGSGSHLMSFAHARSRGWPVEELAFVEVGTLAGAVDAFRNGTADVFFWEKFMTIPLVEAGDFRRVGEFSAPWPAFVVCVRLDCWARQAERVVRIVAEAFEQAATFKRAPETAERIERVFGIRESDAKEWLDLTHWSETVDVDSAMLEATAEVLLAAGAITAMPSILPLRRHGV